MDFLRLNFQSTIVLLIIIAIVELFRYKLKDAAIDVELIKYCRIGLRILTGLIVLFAIIGLLFQAAVNNIPRAEIDRSYIQTKQAQFEANASAVTDSIKRSQK